MARPWASLLLTLSLAPAWAGWSATSTVLVVHTDPDSDAVRQALTAAFGEEFSADLVHVEALLEDTGLTWGATWPAVLTPCRGEAQTSAAVEAEVKDIELLVRTREYAEADERLDRLAASICGCTEPLPSDTLPWIALLRGIIRFHGDDPEGARKRFREAAERAAGLAWNDTFTRDAQEAFGLGMEDASKSPRTGVRVPAGNRFTRVWVNGSEIVAGSGPKQLMGAMHLVQVQREGEAMHGAWLEVNGAEGLDLVPLSRVPGGLDAHPWSVEGRIPFGVTASALQRRGDATAMLMTAADADTGWLFDAEAKGGWREVSLDAGRSLEQARREQLAGGVVALSGGALVVAGGIVAAVGFTREGEEAQHLGGIGLGLATVGVSSLVGGLILGIQARATEQKATDDPRLDLGLGLSRDSAWIGLSGEFR